MIGCNFFPTGTAPNLLDGLLSFWELHEFVTPYEDYIGTKTLTDASTGVTTTATTIGALATFDGISQILSGSDSGLPSGASPRTISFWIKCSTLTAGDNFVIKYGTTGMQQAMGVGISGGDFGASGSIWLSVYFGEAYTIGVNVLDGNLHHVAVTYDGASFAIWVDGINATLGGTPTIAINTTLGEDLTFGTWPSLVGSYGHYEGLIGNAGIWNRVLNPTEITLLSLGYAPYPAPQPHPSWWTFDEGIGSTSYDWAYLNTGTITGATYSLNCPTLAVNNRYSLSFNGSAFVTATDTGLPSGNASRSVMCWVNTSTVGYSYAMCYGTSAVQQGFAIGVDPSGNFIFSNLQTATSSGIVITDGLWHHIAVTYNGTTQTLYLDGVSVHTDTLPIGTVLSTMYIGNGNVGVAAGPLTGFIDDARVYNVCLTAPQIATIAVVQPFPISWWKFDEGSGTTANDSADSNTGTITGATYSADAPFLYNSNPYSLSFAGSDSVTATDTGMPIGSSPRTMMCWLNTTDTTGSGAAIYHFCVDYGTVNTGQSFVIGYRTDSGLAFFSTLGGPALDSTSVVNDGLWHHIAATYDGTTATIYVDGIAEASITYSVSTVLSGVLTIGYPQRNDFSATIGLIDDVRVYNVCLTAPQIAVIAVPQP